MKKKKFDPLDEVLNIGSVSAGTMFVGSLPGLIDSPISDKVSSSMGKTLPLLPMMSGVGSVFRSMDNLMDVEKKTKRRKY